jgi:RraA family protein
MPLTIHPSPQRLLSAQEIAAWQAIPAAVVSDELNRASAMVAGVKPLAPGMAFVGQALTVQCMVADNAALHYALTVAWPGAVLTADAGGFLGNAVWGGILHYAAKKAGLAAVVVDGAMRDADSIGKMNFPVYARGINPRGPYKAGPGEINVPISCGGVVVHPGDIVAGDADGVLVIPRLDGDAVLARAKRKLAQEFATREAIEAGTWDRSGYTEERLRALGCEIIDAAYGD